MAVKLYSRNSFGLRAFNIEYESYEKLNSTTSETFKKYGISPIYFFGDFQESKVLVMLKFYSNLGELVSKNFEHPTEIWLNMFLQLVCIITIYAPR